MSRTDDIKREIERRRKFIDKPGAGNIQANWTEKGHVKVSQTEFVEWQELSTINTN